jgi:hypothetical protein
MLYPDQVFGHITNASGQLKILLLDIFRYGRGAG